MMDWNRLVIDGVKAGVYDKEKVKKFYNKNLITKEQYDYIINNFDNL